MPIEDMSYIPQYDIDSTKPTHVHGSGFVKMLLYHA